MVAPQCTTIFTGTVHAQTINTGSSPEADLRAVQQALRETEGIQPQP